LIVSVDDPEDPRVADYVRLTDPDLRRMREQGPPGAGGFFIAEGSLVIRTLLTASPFAPAVRSLLLTPVRYEALAPVLGAVDAPIYVADQAVVNEVSGFALHRGALASVERPALPSVASLCGAASLVVMTEGVNDHENVGSLFRNCAAFGVDAVVLDRTSCDPLYRRAVRVSMGHVLRVPFAVLDRPAADGVAELQALGVEVLGLTPAADAEDVRGVGAGNGQRRALVVGAEGPGLSAEVLAACDRRVRIPMAAGVDSLNVATAAAIALHELAQVGGSRRSV
jgi:tRNA G18 (ribose-2'-O)-methylase SpoU